MNTLPAPKSLRVLLLDDDPVTLLVVGEMLLSIGIADILTASNGEEGLARLDGQSMAPDLLICDLQMPGMDGIQFLRHVAERGYSGDIILLSGVPVAVLKAAERLSG